MTVGPLTHSSPLRPGGNASPVSGSTILPPCFQQGGQPNRTEPYYPGCSTAGLSQPIPLNTSKSTVTTLLTFTQTRLY
ncbi:hypothetical protein GOBAR_DD26386 [Gossypium barbadense]|nr:hypothetical protein GOBAR_DD26386 [Gossypium barbadense]